MHMELQSVVEAENRVELGERAVEPHMEAAEESKKLKVDSDSAEKTLQEWCSKLISTFLAVVCIVHRIVANITQSENMQVGKEAVNEQARKSMEVITQRSLSVNEVIEKVQRSSQQTESNPTSIADVTVPISKDIEKMMDEAQEIVNAVHAYQSAEKMRQAEYHVNEAAEKLLSAEQESYERENTKAVEAAERALKEAKEVWLKLKKEGGIPPEKSVTKYQRELKVAVESLNAVWSQVISRVSGISVGCGARVQAWINKEKGILGPKQVDGETMNRIEADFVQMEKWIKEINQLALELKKCETSPSLSDLTEKLRTAILTTVQVIDIEKKIVTQIDDFQAKEDRKRAFEKKKQLSLEAKQTGKDAINAEAEAIVAEMEYKAAIGTGEEEKAKVKMEQKQTEAKKLKEKAVKEATAIKAIEAVEEREKLKEELEKEGVAREVAEAKVEYCEKRIKEYEKLVVLYKEKEENYEERMEAYEKLAVLRKKEAEGHKEAYEKQIKTYEKQVKTYEEMLLLYKEKIKAYEEIKAYVAYKE
jgi:hypothetical protein